jgi:subtilase family serine protease
MPKRSIRRAAVVVGAAGASTALAVAATAGATVQAASAASSRPQPRAQAVRNIGARLSTLEVVPDVFASGPPTTADCTAQTGLYCYGPKQIETAYEMGPLYKKGDTGKGETIVIVDSFGSPTVKSDLATFDKAFGLPAPPKFTIIHPAGTPPKYNPNNSTMVSWAEETSLDVQYSHAMAPGADILLVETPVAETVGVHGFPQIVRAENYVINHHLGQVISQSFATAEATFPSKTSLLDLRSAYKNAAQHHVTVLAGAGDWGASSPSDASGSTYFTGRTANWPASDPLVTAVGGTQLHLNAAGQRLLPDNVWNENSLLGAPVAAGGTTSDVFTRPSYQNGVASVTGNHRGVPDISLSAAVDGGVLVYMSFAPIPAGYYIIGGTSEATPLFAGFIAVADQVAGHPLGLVNPLLYKLAAQKAAGIVDVTIGENTVSFVQGGRDHTVPGYVATPGYDLASGLGTIDGAELAPELAKASKPSS